MSELQFPKYPIVGQEYDFAPYRYYWDGTKWKTKGIGYNPVNELRDELEPRVSNNESKAFESLRRSYADAGFNLVEGSFEEGGQLLVASDVMITASGDGYSWVGPEFPHNVAEGTDPTLSGSGYVPRTDVVLRNELAADDGAALIGGLTFVSPLHFGGVPGGLVDATQAINDAISKCKLNNYALDLRGGPWLFSQTLDFTGVRSVVSDYSGRLICNPVGFSAATADVGAWAVTFGLPIGGAFANRNDAVVIEGTLWVESLNRDAALDGVYLKGSWINAGHIRAYNFNGHGVYRDSVWDSTFQRISVELCGNGTKHAYWHSSVGDTSNASNTTSLQVEQAYHRGFYINAIRDVISNIHAERLYQLTSNDGSANIDGSTWTNSHIVLGNSNVTQMICDSATSSPPTGESIIGGQTYRIRIEGDGISVDDASVSGVVLCQYGAGMTLTELHCDGYLATFPASNITLINPDVVTLAVEGKLSVVGGSIYNLRNQFNAANQSFNHVTIDNINFTANIIGDIYFNSCDIRLVADTKIASSPYKAPAEFYGCTIQEYQGAYNSRANIHGGYVHLFSLASQGLPHCFDVEFGTFSPTGNSGYLTRGCTANSVSSWTHPLHVNYPSGTVTERVGYDAAGKLYQNTDGALNWVKLA